jgi:hypothetical protein
MSALPVIEPFIEHAPVTRTRTAPRTLPRFPEPIIIELPTVRTRKGRSKKAQTQKRVSTLVGQLASFTVMTGIAFSTLSLAGQVMVEKARRDGIRATYRARQTSREIADLRGQVQELSSSRSIDDWAAANGFIATDSAAHIGANQSAPFRH